MWWTPWLASLGFLDIIGWKSRSYVQHTWTSNKTACKPSHNIHLRTLTLIYDHIEISRSACKHIVFMNVSSWYKKNSVPCSLFPTKIMSYIYTGLELQWSDFNHSKAITSLTNMACLHDAILTPDLQEDSTLNFVKFCSL